MGPKIGAMVELLVRGAVVGAAKIKCNVPAETCHCVELGLDRVSVEIVDIYRDVRLPFPFGDYVRLNQARGCFTLWSRCDISIMGSPTPMARMETQGSPDSPETSPISGVGSSPVTPVSVTPSSSPNGVASMSGRKSGSPSMDFSNRKAWHLREAILINPRNSDQKLAKGFMNYNLPSHCVNGVSLGEDRVGLVIPDDFIFCKGDPELMEEFFTGYSKGVPLVVVWSISNLFIPSMGMPLSELYSQDPDSRLDDTPPEFKPREKRHYNYINRSKRDAEDKRQEQFSKKRQRLTEHDAVLDASKMACCSNDCCIKADRAAIRRERYYYWGLSPGDRTTMMLEKFNSRDAEKIRTGKMVFNTLPICKTAFYQLYGFGKTLFFEYQRKYESGAQVGFHWGIGQTKPSDATMMATEYLRTILAESSEPQPHLEYTGDCGTDTIMFKLPISYCKETVFEELNRTLKKNNLKSISASNFYSIWRKNFANYQAYKTSAFAKCSICSSIKERLQNERTYEVRQKILAERSAHLVEAHSRRSTYYANRAAAESAPQKFLSVIHDKMDQAKTGIPKLVEYNKEFCTGCAPLPFALTGMLTHGREPGVFGHFSLNGLWPSDPNFTISSLAKLLRDLERWDGDRSGDLSISSNEHIQEPLLKALLNPEPFQAGYLRRKGLTLDDFRDKAAESHHVPLHEGAFNPLPRHFLLQLDNSGKDNKNRAVMAFCSELVARGVFETVQVSFLMVGHTHEDVDALFSKVSLHLRQKEVQTLHELMALFWSSQENHPVPSVIQEVADYKAYSDAFLKEMTGQKSPISFFFSMKGNVPVYQYRFTLTGPWHPHGGRCLWKQEDADGKPIVNFLPSGSPKAVDIERKLRKRDDVMTFLRRYIKWKTQNGRDPDSYASSMLPTVVSYWESILDIIKTTFRNKDNSDPRARGRGNGHGVDGGELQHGFWPRTDHGTGYRSDYVEDAAVAQHPLELEHADNLRDNDTGFVGPYKEMECERFDPITHIKENAFVILRPSDKFEQEVKRAVWLARAINKIDMTADSEHYGQFQVEWWRPVHKETSPPESIRYANWQVRSRYWERDPYQKKHDWQDGTAAIYSWVPSGRFPKKQIKLSTGAHDAIKDYLGKLPQT